MKALVISIVFLFSLSVFATDCPKHPIYCQILRNKPSVNKTYALKLSNIIHKYCLKHGIPKIIFTAILMQESVYRLSARGCHNGLVREEICGNVGIDMFRLFIKSPNCEFRWKEVRACADFGISQIYYRTAKRYGFDTDRLTTDLEYSVEAGAIVLRDFKKRYGHKEVYWWTRYNASSKTKREIYQRLVERYF